MSYIPSCREDEFYNYESLEKSDKIFIDGYDYVADDIVSAAFNNLDMFEFKCDEGFTVSLGEYLNSKPKLKEALLESILEFIEISRDETIVSILDGYENDYDYYDGKHSKEEYDEEENISEPSDSEIEQSAEEEYIEAEIETETTNSEEQ